MKTHRFFNFLGILALFLSAFSPLFRELSIEQKQHMTLTVISFFVIAIYYRMN